MRIKGLTTTKVGWSLMDEMKGRVIKTQAIKNAPADVPGQQGATSSTQFQYSPKSTINPEEYLGLVGYIVREYSYSNTKEEFEDLFQEGCIGLVKAARDFDPRRGTKFSTLAGFAVKNNINQYLRKNKRWDKINLVLDCPVNREKNNLTFLDLLEDPSIDFENETVDHLTNQPALKQAIKQLSARELQVVHMRYFENMTQKKIAEKIQTYPAKVSKMLSKTIEKLRYHMEVAQ